MVFEVPVLGVPVFRVEALGVLIFSVSVWGSQFDDVSGFGPYVPIIGYAVSLGRLLFIMC